MTAYEALESRPIQSRQGRPGSKGDDASRGFLPAHDDAMESIYATTGNNDDDSVLLGTVVQPGIGLGTTLPSAQVRQMQQTSGSRAPPAPGQLQSPAAAVIRGVTPGATSSATTTSKPYVFVPPSPSSSSPTATPAVPNNIVGGFKFGLTNSGNMPALPLFPPSSPTRAASPSPPSSRPASPAPAGKIKFGISSDSQPRGSFEFVVKNAAREQGSDEYEDDEQGGGGLGRGGAGCDGEGMDGCWGRHGHDNGL